MILQITSPNTQGFFTKQSVKKNEEVISLYNLAHIMENFALDL